MKSMTGDHELERAKYLADRKRFGLSLLIVVAALMVASIVWTTTASAAGPMGEFAKHGPSVAVVLFVGTLIVGVVAGGLYIAEKKAMAMPAGIVAVALLVTGILVYVLASIGGAGANCVADPTLPECRPGPDYVANWSMGTDLAILFKTIAVVFGGKGAC